MANNDHIAQLTKGAAAWNAWRDATLDILQPDFSGANLIVANLGGANLSGAMLFGANLIGADLRRANLSDAHLDDVNLSDAGLTDVDLGGANLRGANLTRANLGGANLRGANLTRANLRGADLRGADLRGPHFAGEGLTDLSDANLMDANLGGANLDGAILSRADLRGANLSGADLSGASLMGADLTMANLSGANLGGADLEHAAVVDTFLSGADLTGCRIYGISAWNLKLEATKQQNLIVTPRREPDITVDNIEVAQFVYLLLHNEKIRDVIDTITSKAVLILGRFTDERKAVLDALREELRKRDYLPILFDFEKPRSRDTDETITLLARMARFVVADISDAKAVLQELRAIVPDLPSVPVQPIILAIQEEPGMFDFYRNRPSFLTVHRYADQDQLLADLGDKVIRPAELKVLELRG
jgi:uncharacterized protein YjbI with pentapeptide repeats